jgi:ABC-type nickel/cobalt efflux system permease component RcnA
MVFLGLLLLIVAIAAGVVAALRGDASVHVDLRWFDLDTNAAGVFFIGAAAMLVFVLGWWMIARSMRRNRERRREMKGLRKRAEASEEAAQRERQARASERADADAPRVIPQRDNEGAHAGPGTTRRDS